MENSIVLITGASSGIGEACAYRFAEEGSKLILLARRGNKIQELAEKLIDKFKVEILTFQCDVTNRGSVEEVEKLIPAAWKNIDVLINNAGLARGQEKFPDCNYNDWEEMIDTNIKGLLYVTKTFVPFLNKTLSTIINIGSIAGNTAYPGGNVYCGTKAFVKMITEGMNIDFNGTGIRVTNIAPGMVETEFSIVRYHGDQDRADKVYNNLTPLIGDDVADAAYYVASRPQYVNIQEIVITPTAQANPYVVHRESI